MQIPFVNLKSSGDLLKNANLGYNFILNQNTFLGIEKQNKSHEIHVHLVEPGGWNQDRKKIKEVGSS